MGPYGEQRLQLPRAWIQKLRLGGLIWWKGDNLVVLNPDRLIEFSGFNPNYLHLAGRNGQKEAL